MKENSLVRMPEKLSDKLLPIEKTALEAYYKPKIKELAKKEFAPQIIKAITKAYMVMGHSVPDTFEQTCEEVIHELKSLFSTYTTEEVCAAFDMGSKGRLDDAVHISVTNLLKWVHKYNELVRKEAVHKQKQYEEKQALILEETARQAKNQEFEQEIIKTFENFPESFKNRSKGELAAHYRQLDKMGLIKLTTPVKKEIFNQILKIKDRTKWAKKGLLEITAKELAEYRALRITFKGWKGMEIDLIEEIKLTKLS